MLTILVSYMDILFSQGEGALNNLFFALFTVLGINILILAIFGASLAFVMKRVLLSQSEFAREKEEARRQAILIRDDAHAEAMRIVDEARKQASQTLSRTSEFVGGADAQFTQALNTFIDSEKTKLARVPISSPRRTGD